MPAFSITPAGPFPAPASDGFPDYIQWQFEGVNLGDATVTTVNFVAGAPGSDLTVTRGTGENAGVLTVTIPSG